MRAGGTRPERKTVREAHYGDEVAAQAINTAKAALSADNAFVAGICAKEAMEFAVLVPRGHGWHQLAYDFAVRAQKHADSL